MLLELADVLRQAGLDVVERPGWQRRGHGDMAAIQSITLHHTAGPKTGDTPSLHVVEDGRPDLKGPLAHLLLARSGTWHVVAAGLCWHTGLTFEAWQANPHAIGIEAEATGKDVWPTGQYASFVRGARALADHYRVPYARVVGHKEVARPAGRKIDPNFDLAAFRAALPAPPEDDVPLTANEIAAIADAVWLRGRPNYWGDVVAPLQIVNGSEARVSDVQNKVAAPGGVDLDALAAKVVDLLAARLGQ